MELLGTLVIQQNVMGWSRSAKVPKPRLVGVARVEVVTHVEAKSIVEAHSAALPEGMKAFYTYTFYLSERLEPKGERR